MICLVYIVVEQYKAASNLYVIKITNTYLPIVTETMQWLKMSLIISTE